MAQPPIIISNGGVASALTTNLVPAPGVSGTAVDIIMRNVADLNAKALANAANRPVAMVLNRKKDAKILWRLSGDIRRQGDEDHEVPELP